MKGAERNAIKMETKYLNTVNDKLPNIIIIFLYHQFQQMI